jgi:hypothetical protein
VSGAIFPGGGSADPRAADAVTVPIHRCENRRRSTLFNLQPDSRGNKNGPSMRRRDMLIPVTVCVGSAAAVVWWSMGPSTRPPGGTDTSARGTMISSMGRLNAARSAADAGDWAAAAVNVSEAESALTASREALPVEQRIAHFGDLFDKRFPALRSAAAERDAKKFHAAWADAIASCNACHRATNAPPIAVPARR